MRCFAVSLVASFLVSLIARAEEPFDFNKTPGKLPKHVVPQEYAIRITPDVEKRTFAGSETIKLDVRQPTRELVLNAADMQIAGASVNGKEVAKSRSSSNRRRRR
jgi:aminopeptidase N